MSYTPPDWNAANFTWEGESSYTAPAWDEADLPFEPTAFSATLLGVGIMGAPAAHAGTTATADLTGVGILGTPLAQAVQIFAQIELSGIIGVPGSVVGVRISSGNTEGPLLGWMGQGEYTPSADFDFYNPFAEGQIRGVGILGAPTVLAASIQGAIQLPGILGIPSVVGHSIAAQVQGTGILGLPQAVFLTGPSLVTLTGAGILGVPEMLAENPRQASAADGFVHGDLLGYLLGIVGAEAVSTTDAGLSSLEVSASLEDTTSWSEIGVGTLTALATAEQSMQIEEEIAAIYPLLAEQSFDLDDDTSTTVTLLLQLASTLTQMSLARGQVETKGNLFEQLGMQDLLSSVFGASAAEILTAYDAVDWDVRRELLAAEAVRLSELTWVGLEIRDTLAGALALTNRLKFGLSVGLSEEITAASSNGIDVKQLLQAIDGVFAGDNANTILELTASLQANLVNLDKLRFGLTHSLSISFTITEAITVPITLLQARELMAVGASPTAVAELAIRLREVLRADTISATVVGLLAGELLTATGNALTEIYFGARAVELALLHSDTAASLEIGKLAREFVVLAETTGFGAQWGLAEQLIATVLASPDAASVLRALEQVNVSVVLSVLGELNASLKERWSMMDGMGLTLPLRAATTSLFGDNLGLDALRWAKAGDTLTTTAESISVAELTARLGELVSLADSAGFRFLLSMTEGLVLESTLPGLLLRVNRLSSSLQVASSTALQLELVARLLEVVTAQEIAGAISLLSAEEVATISTSLSKAIVATVVAPSTLQLLDALHCRFTVVVQDTSGWSDYVTGLSELLTSARESLAFIESFPLSDGDYQAWVLNSNNLGVTSYSNMLYDKLISYKGKTLGLNSTGLYELTGDTDDGTPIDAWLRTGQIHLGTEHSKNMSRAYLYVKGDGDLYLRTIATVHGCRQDYWYKITPNAQDGDAETTHRLRLRRTVFALSWSFEIHNVDGSDFDLRGAEILPVILRRRT